VKGETIMDHLGISRSEVVKHATSKLHGIPGLNIDRAAMTVDPDFGKVIIAAHKKSPVSSIDQLAKGAVVAAMHIEGAKPEIGLSDGVYRLHVFNDQDTWTCQLLAGTDGNTVAFTSTNVQFLQIAESIDQPLVTAFGFGFLVAFLLGVCVGLAIACYLK
jgi:hypothetical protein